MHVCTMHMQCVMQCTMHTQCTTYVPMYVRTMHRCTVHHA